MSESRRIAVPEGSVALILPNMLANELESMCRILRARKHRNAFAMDSIRSVAGDVLLAMMDQREDSLPLVLVTRKNNS